MRQLESRYSIVPIIFRKVILFHSFMVGNTFNRHCSGRMALNQQAFENQGDTDEDENLSGEFTNNNLVAEMMPQKLAS